MSTKIFFFKIKIFIMKNKKIFITKEKKTQKNSYQKNFQSFFNTNYIK